jgi:cystathionine beta-lyase
MNVMTTQTTQLSTHLIHHAYQPPADFAAPQPGVFKASTVIFPNVAAMRSREWKDKSAYTYGLHGTPTTFILEERLCTLEGGKQCLLVPSGLAAIANVALALLKTGDEVLIPDNAYGPNKTLAEGELKAFGITHRYYDALNPADLAAKISPQTRLVWVEAAGSCTLEFPDLPALVDICRAKGVVSALDNTWGAGLAFRPFDFAGAPGARYGVDVSMQALTKYPSGGGDVLMGSIITTDPALHMRLKLTHMRLGLGVSGNDTEMVLRSLPTIALRYGAHDAATRTLAAWCTQRPEFAQVLHPALASSPGHANWRTLCCPDGGVSEPGRAAGLFSVMLHSRYSRDQVDAFCDSLALFKLGYSWGGPMSLIVPYALAEMRGGWPAHLSPGHLVRFSTGLEAVTDLQADLQQALEKAFH